MVALVSRSRDGELVAAALARLGVAERARIVVARGRGGPQGHRAASCARGSTPRSRSTARAGPRAWCGATGGVRAQAARLGGGVVVPMAAACARCHVFARAWDRFELPLPFTRVVVVLGAPLDPGRSDAGGARRGDRSGRGRRRSGWCHGWRSAALGHVLSRP